MDAAHKENTQSLTRHLRHCFAEHSCQHGGRSSNTESWDNLLSFVPTILAKPGRGAEEAVHAVRRLVEYVPHDHAIRPVCTVNLQTCVKIIAAFRAQMSSLLMPRLLKNIIQSLKDGKAASLDSLTAEHLKYCHPALATVLAKLLNIILIFAVYRLHSVAATPLPILKGGHVIGTSLKVDDFRVYLSALCYQKYLYIVYLTFMYLTLQPATNNLSLKGGLAVSTLYTP